MNTRLLGLAILVLTSAGCGKPALTPGKPVTVTGAVRVVSTDSDEFFRALDGEEAKEWVIILNVNDVVYQCWLKSSAKELAGLKSGDRVTITGTYEETDIAGQRQLSKCKIERRR